MYHIYIYNASYITYYMHRGKKSEIYTTANIVHALTFESNPFYF